MDRIFLASSALIILLSTNSLGQDFERAFAPCFHCEPIPVNDWGLIFQGTVSKKLKENFKGELNVQSRIMDEFKTLKAVMIEPGIKLKITDHFAVKSAFRYSMLSGQFNSYRVHLAGYYIWHKEGVPLRIQFRSRVEQEDYFYWRNRIKLAFNIRQILKPYSSFEVFNQSDNKGFLDLIRYEGGIKWEMLDSYNITLMYRLETNVNWHYRSNKAQVIGLMLNHSF